MRSANIYSKMICFLSLQGEYLHAKINHLQLIELNTVRPLLPHAFDQINRWARSILMARIIGGHSID